MKLFRSTPHTTNHALQALLNALKVRVTKTGSEACLNEHPDYPSLMAIGSCLTDWGVENHTYKIDKEVYQEDLLFPFLAHFPENGGRFVVITAIKGKQIFYSDELITNGVLTEEEFLKRWDGVALHAEPSSKSGEADYAQNRLKEFLKAGIAPTFILSFAALLYLAFTKQGANWSILVLSLLKLCGIGVSVLLLMQSLNAHNPFIKNLCALNGKNDCNAILKSDAANVTSWLSWSEVGLFYFTGSLLCLLFAHSSFPFLALLNLFTLPYTVFSVTYQYQKKNWCILCCSVQALLILEAITFFYAKNYGLSNFNSYGLLVIVSFLFPVLTWSFLKPFFTDASQIKLLKNQLKKFKYNRELFNQALKNQPRYVLPDNLMPIILGNPHANTIITMISNPFCAPCAKAHEILEKWLKTTDVIQLNVVFVTADEESDLPTKISRHLRALSMVGNRNEVADAMNNWYKSTNKDYDEWASKYPVVMNKGVEIVTKNQKSWCDFAEIEVTPTFLINGYKLPDPYKLEDIRYLLT